MPIASTTWKVFVAQDLSSRLNSAAAAALLLLQRIDRIVQADFGRRRVTQPGRVRQPTNFDRAIPRGVQSGNPLQMLNPFAPKEYGNGADLVSDEQGPPTPRPQYKVGRGFRLLSIEF